MIPPSLLDILAEQRTAAAQRRGEFDDLPGADSLVPEELRVAHRILKNSAHVPPEVKLRREIWQLMRVLQKPIDQHERSKALSKLEMLRIKVGSARVETIASGSYIAQVVDRLE